MSRHLKAPEKPASFDDHPPVEAIVACSCAHLLQEHSEMGCMIGKCECDVERSMLVVGKVLAVDEM